MPDGDDVEVYNGISGDDYELTNDNEIIKADIFHYLLIGNVLISANSFLLNLGKLSFVRMTFIAESVDHKYIITRNYAGGLPS